MSKMAKSEQLRLHMKTIDALLIAGSSRGSVSPVVPKTNDGSDRYGGFPPA